MATNDVARQSSYDLQTLLRAPIDSRRANEEGEPPIMIQRPVVGRSRELSKMLQQQNTSDVC